MNTPATLQAIAQALVHARRTGTPCPMADPACDLSEADAYAIQAMVAQGMGWFASGRPTAWKVGGTTTVSAAPLPEVLSSPAHWPHTDGSPLLVEAELAFRLQRTPQHAHDMLDSLGSVCVSLEVIGTRWREGLNTPAVWKLADQGVHGGLVIGPEQPFSACQHFTLADWGRQRCHLSVDGEVRREGAGGHPAISPLTTLSWLYEHAARHTGGLQAGDLITTGAWLMDTVPAGSEVCVGVAGFGEVRVRV